MPLSLPSFITSLPPIPLGILTTTTFLLSLFLLERSSSSFITHTTRLSTRLNIPPILIALLTAGCEWEELAVVVAALAEGDSPLALGNVWGSSVANVLGGFSIGLLVGVKGLSDGEIMSAKIYTGVLFGLSIFLAVVSSGIGPFSSLTPTTTPSRPPHNTSSTKAVRALGITLILLFAVYLIAIGWGIYRGVMVAPESDSDFDSDSDSNSDASSSSDSGDGEETDSETEGGGGIVRRRVDTESGATERTPLVRPRSTPTRTPIHKTLLSLLLATFLLSLSGLLLSLSCTLLSSPTLLNLQSSKLGLTLLSLSTTIPEKVLAFKAGRKGEVGLVVANTVGGNVFLGTLVLGLCWVVRGSMGYEAVEELTKVGAMVAGSGSRFSGSSLDALISCVCSGLLVLIVWLGLWKRWVGGVMLAGYAGYIVSVFFRE